jgi:acyl-CoA synthetase (AMP-forming)/AMP-acid ligase II
MMSGYYDDPAMTAETLPDGWIRTHDLGHFDGHGLLHLVGRSRDVIIVNAQICYAVPIESALESHPAIAQAQVLGTPDDVTGESIHAFVVPTTPGATVPLPDLQAIVRTALGDNSVPATITFLPEIPQTPTGKPDKPALRATHLG